MYASLFWIWGALHLDILENPDKNDFFNKFLRVLWGKKIG